MNWKALKFIAVVLLSFSSLHLNACGSAEEEPVFDPPKQEEGDKIKVLSYNIHHGNPPSRPDFIDMPAIAKVIKDSGADLVALQEVDVYTERSGKELHQAKELEELTGMHYYFFKSIDYQGGEYGNAILSRFPIEESEGYPLPYEEGTEPRAVIAIKVKLENEKEIIFASTHLDFSSASNNIMQARELTDILGEEELPVILAGDFNTEPGSETIAHLDGYFTRTCNQSCAPTIPVNDPKKVIDFIMFSTGKGLKTLTHYTINETYASDHLPVYAELGWE